VTDPSKTPTLGQVLYKKPITLLFVPLVNLVLIVVFWQSQIAQYTTSTEGVLIMWLIAGLVFGLIQISLLTGAWRQTLRSQSITTAIRTETLWLLGVQIGTLGVMTAYSILVTSKLWQLGVYPNQPLDFAIMAIFAVTLATVGWFYGRRKKLADPSARLWLATGAKVTPQLLQAVGLAWYGSHGMHLLTLLTVVIMTVMRYILARATVHRQTTPHTVSANKAAFRDLLAVGAMTVGWVIGRAVLDSHYALVRILTNRHPGRSRDFL
jgi:hypothetical protein